MKNIFKLKGTITHIGELVHIEREGIPDLYKKTLTVELDDSQILYPEIRNQRLKLFEKEMIESGNKVEIGFTFEGSEKNGKRYNNIYINSIKCLNC